MGLEQVELSRKAERDLGKIGPGPELKRIARALEKLPNPLANLDIVPLSGRPPWRRLRVGDWRVLFRETDGGVLVARVVHRSALDQAVSTLPSVRARRRRRSR